MVEDIIDPKTQTDCLIVKNAQLIAGRAEVEAAFDEACQHVYENTQEIDAVAEVKRLGKVIVLLQLTNNLLNSMVYPKMLPKLIVECKDSIEAVTAQFEVMEKEVKNISEVMT